MQNSINQFIDNILAIRKGLKQDILRSCLKKLYESCPSKLNMPNEFAEGTPFLKYFMDNAKKKLGRYKKKEKS